MHHDVILPPLWCLCVGLFPNSTIVISDYTYPVYCAFLKFLYTDQVDCSLEDTIGGFYSVGVTKDCYYNHVANTVV